MPAPVGFFIPLGDVDSGFKIIDALTFAFGQNLDGNEKYAAGG